MYVSEREDAFFFFFFGIQGDNDSESPPHNYTYIRGIMNGDGGYIDNPSNSHFRNVVCWALESYVMDKVPV